MKRALILVAVAGALASGAAAAGTTVQFDRDARFVQAQYAQNYDERIARWDDRSQNVNERERRINARIERGIQDGRLTGWEARRLRRDLANIESKERAFMADGHLNWRENQELNRDLDRLADNVRAQLRDEDRRYGYNEGRRY
jgi:hypothetical protein